MPKSTAPASEEAPKDYFNSLPNELLEQIAGHLQLPDKLKFRLLMRKSDHEFIASILKEHLNRVYVCPTKRSLGNFGGICRSKFYNEHIKEVVFVPRSYDSDSVMSSIEDFKEYCQKKIDELDEGSRLSMDELTKVAKKIDNRLIVAQPDHFREWYVQDEFLRRSFKIHQEVAKQFSCCNDDLEKGSALENIVDILELGMLRLPKLNAVTVITEMSGPGLNRTSVWCDSRETLQDCQNYNIHPFSRDLTVRYALEALTQQITGTQALYRALTNPRITPISIQIHQIMGWGYAEHENYCLASGITADGFAANLKALHIHGLDRYACTDDREEEYLQQWTFLAGKAVCLTDLTIEMEPQHWFEKGINRIVDIFLRSGNHPRLSRFKIVGNLSRMPTRRTHTNVLVSDLHRFLVRHKQTLRKVELHELYAHNKNRRAVAIWMKRLLAWMQRGLSLEHCVFTVRSHGDGDVKCCNQRGSAYCLAQCQRYILSGRKQIGREVFEQLGSELSVVREGRFWDFGKFVMQGSMSEQIGRELDEFLAGLETTRETAQQPEARELAEPED